MHTECGSCAAVMSASHPPKLCPTTPRIEVILRRYLGPACPREYRVGILEAVGEGERAARAPHSAEVHIQRLVSGAPNGLREIEVPLVAGISVEKDHQGMVPRACSQVHDPVHPRAMALDRHLLHRSRWLDAR